MKFILMLLGSLFYVTSPNAKINDSLRGGTVEIVGEFTIHKFYKAEKIVVSKQLKDVEVLVVGAGGGSNGQYGGDAGDLKIVTVNLSKGNYLVTVGCGGGELGQNGGDSSFKPYNNEKIMKSNSCKIVNAGSSGENGIVVIKYKTKQ